MKIDIIEGIFKFSDMPKDKTIEAALEEFGIKDWNIDKRNKFILFYVDHADIWRVNKFLNNFCMNDELFEDYSSARVDKPRLKNSKIYLKGKNYVSFPAGTIKQMEWILSGQQTKEEKAKAELDKQIWLKVSMEAKKEGSIEKFSPTTEGELREKDDNKEITCRITFIGEPKMPKG